ncbi:MAG TPA: TOBE domain-containing protein, partial [Burkholderiaceae bacterium]|nr:TOBE domain-containing protein [Burkholderiaceae bacterium]
QFVAQFIGTPQMNVVSATVLPALTRIAGSRLPSDGSVGVRPEYVRVLGNGSGSIPGSVELVEALGSDTLIHVKVASDVHLIARQGERTGLKLGDPVGIEIDRDALLYFDKQGRALRELQQAA